MAIDGTLISNFSGPELNGPNGVHVTPTGQVLVYAFNSHSVIQVDRKGKINWQLWLQRKMESASVNLLQHQQSQDNCGSIC
ncbi:hypothetical protein DPMN_184659 [Dreissena polymorpha]|uniref:Uncharacterized protein n=1 Tax=Dreissena polymorpha TaxID=45954 RepID=A0A9D4DJ61_DREPO|nr:hypothetical protein DPMN_184659 [Dreissena polymorpha]